jgi:hypothetical protein
MTGVHVSPPIKGCVPQLFHYHDINSRKIKWAGHVVHKEKRRMQTVFWWGNLREQDQWED